MTILNMKMNLKMSSSDWCPCCIGLNMLKNVPVLPSGFQFENHIQDSFEHKCYCWWLLICQYCLYFAYFEVTSVPQDMDDRDWWCVCGGVGGGGGWGVGGVGGGVGGWGGGVGGGDFRRSPNSCGCCNSTTTDSIGAITSSLKTSLPVLDVQRYGHWLARLRREFPSGT